MNTLNIQNELETSINKISVNGGNTVTNNLDYPVVNNNGTVEKIEGGVHNVVSSTGKVLGKVSGAVYSLGERAIDSTIAVGEGVFDTGKHVINTGIDVTKDLAHGIKDSASEIGTSAIDIGKITINTTVHGVTNIKDGAVNLGTNTYDTGKGIVTEVIDGLKETVNNVSGIVGNLGTGLLKTGSDILTTGKNTATITLSGVEHSIRELLNDTEVVGNTLVDGVKKIGTEVISTGHETINTSVNTLHNVGNDLSSGYNNIKKEIKTTGSKVNNILFKGGKISSGVSVMDINDSNDYNTRMLIPSTFLNTNHIYFVRYHPEGTHVYNYKFNMNGGNVNKFVLSNVNSIWNTDNFNDTISNQTLLNGKTILNNLINDLKTTHIGGYVNKRIEDKDSYYNEYKNAKLKYLSLKNQQFINNLSETSIDTGNYNVNEPYYHEYRAMKDKYLAMKNQ